MAVDQIDELQQQIDARSKEIYSDSYAISIGEIIHMYRDSEIEIHPEFQRFYRWRDEQKSRLIESILLGIPVPPIFVAQRPDGVWDVVDGLQRLATLLEFVGELRDEDGNLRPGLVLKETRHLPALEGVTWDGDEDRTCLTAAQQMRFKRAKLQVNIILEHSDPDTKYDLFERLNTGGAFLSEQGVRNCQLLTVDRRFYHLLRSVAESEAFRQCVPLSERQIEEQYDLELVLRLIVLRRAEPDGLRGVDIAELLTKRMMALASDKGFDYDAERAVCACVFETLADAAGEDCFRRWDASRGRAVGAFSVSAYELVSVGLAAQCAAGAYHGDLDALRERIRSIWSNNEFRSNSGMGVRASTRLPVVVSLGRELFGG